MKKTVFREHIILLIEGRLFMLLLFGAIIWICRLCYLEISADNFVWTLSNVTSIFSLLIFSGLFYYVLHLFWYRCFGKLVITENAVTWRCLGYFPKTIRKEDLRAVGINDNRKTNVVPDVHGTGFQSVYFSTKPYPAEYDGKIDKLRNSSEFIKFPISGKLCACLAEWLPEPQCRRFEPMARDWSQMRKRRQRKCKQKREKLRMRIRACKKVFLR